MNDVSRAIAWDAEMRRVHRRLREAVALARQELDEGTGTGVDPLLYCWGFCAALDGHHRGEDTALFPRLAAAQPRLAPVLARLTQDHNMITHLIGDWRKAVDEGASTEVAHRHLDGIEAVMLTHFRYEERELSPALERLDAPDVEAGDLFGPLA